MAERRRERASRIRMIITRSRPFHRSVAGFSFFRTTSHRPHQALAVVSVSVAILRQKSRQLLKSSIHQFVSPAGGYPERTGNFLHAAFAVTAIHPGPDDRGFIRWVLLDRLLNRVAQLPQCEPGDRVVLGSSFGQTCSLLVERDLQPVPLSPSNIKPPKVPNGFAGNYPSTEDLDGCSRVRVFLDGPERL